MIEMRTRKRVMRDVGGYHDEKLRLVGILWAGQGTIPNQAGKNPDPAYNFTDKRSSHHNQ
jgi:hypothetical protein